MAQISKQKVRKLTTVRSVCIAPLLHLGGRGGEGGRGLVARSSPTKCCKSELTTTWGEHNVCDQQNHVRPLQPRMVTSFKAAASSLRDHHTELFDQRSHEGSLSVDMLSNIDRRWDIDLQNKALSACVRKVQWAAATQLFYEVCKLQLQGTAGTHSTAVNACGKAKIWERALQLWEASSYRHTNVVIHGAIISSLEKVGKWKASLYIFSDSTESRLQNNVITASTAISACAKGRPRFELVKGFCL